MSERAVARHLSGSITYPEVNMMSEALAHVEARPPNWLPIPGEEEKPSRRVAKVDEDDLFCKGDVISFFPKQGVGTIRDNHGRQLPFDVSELALIGDPANLEQGVRIGYDASHTSRGMRITRLKVY